MNDMLQEEIDATLFRMQMDCARPTWLFRLLFGAKERQLLGAAISTLTGERQRNHLMRKLNELYPSAMANNACAQGPMVTTGMSENGVG